MTDRFHCFYNIVKIHRACLVASIPLYPIFCIFNAICVIAENCVFSALTQNIQSFILKSVFLRY